MCEDTQCKNVNLPAASISSMDADGSFSRVCSVFFMSSAAAAITAHAAQWLALAWKELRFALRAVGEGDELLLEGLNV